MIFIGPKTYPAHAIPVDIYCGGRKIKDVPQVCVQVSLDVELWVNEELQTKLLEQGVTYHSLTDYDLQLAEVCVCVRVYCIVSCFVGCVQVCPESGCALLILVALLEAAPLSVTS